MGEQVLVHSCVKDRTAHSSREEQGKALFVNLATCFILVFGISLILNVQVAGDGMWFWYAKLMLQHKELYGQLHLPLQPLYVLLTALFQRLLGDAWLVSKLPAVGMLIISTILLRHIALNLRLRDGPRGVLLLGAFAFPLLFDAYRFDDYHVLADCFEIGSILLLIRMQPTSQASRVRLTSVLLGVCAGFSMMTRLNDGVFLFLSVSLCLFALVPGRRLLILLLYGCSVVLTVALTLLTTHDSLSHWVEFSILHAAGPKGGTSRLPFYPFQLLWHTFHQFFDYPIVLILLLGGVGFWLLIQWLYRRTEGNSHLAGMPQGMCIFCAACVACCITMKVHWWGITVMPLQLCAVSILFGSALAAHSLAKLLYSEFTGHKGIDARALLILIPISQLFSGSLSSGGDFVPLTGPVGILLLTLPYAFPAFFTRLDRAYAYASVIGIASVCCLGHKFYVPFAWHSYRNLPLYIGRQWYSHPVYGPMYIESGLLTAARGICENLPDSRPLTLYSTPFPYSNYFCDVPPWRDQVQTFFDLSTRETVDEIISRLRSSPPSNIVYQRQISNMLLHERIYHSSQPLPHRALDRLIVEKLTDGSWTLLSQQCLLDSDWLVISTTSSTQITGHKIVPFDSAPYRCDGVAASSPASIVMKAVKEELHH